MGQGDQPCVLDNYYMPCLNNYFLALRVVLCGPEIFYFRDPTINS